jgi:adenylate kinase
MDKDEKVDYEQSIEQYIENNKLPDLFDKLMKQLIISQPDDPLSFLIDHLTTKRSLRIIFISGINH